MKKETNQKQRQFIWATVGIIVVLLVLFFVNQNSGPDSSIEITPIGSSADVFIDRNRTTSLERYRPTTYQVNTGRHQIIVAKDGYWPWTDSLATESSEVKTLHPFLIEQTGQRAIQVPTSITDDLAAKQQQLAPTADSPITSPDGNIKIFVDNETNIIAQWTTGTSTAPDYFNCRAGICGVSVYNNQPVLDISFYPERSDVIFFATNTGVYAIEVDPSSDTQNFQPVAENVSNPLFVFDNNRIFVSTNGRVTVSEI
jgi:hypothetical protein